MIIIIWNHHYFRRCICIIMIGCVDTCGNVTCTTLSPDDLAIVCSCSLLRVAILTDEGAREPPTIKDPLVDVVEDTIWVVEFESPVPTPVKPPVVLVTMGLLLSTILDFRWLKGDWSLAERMLCWFSCFTSSWATSIEMWCQACDFLKL